MTVKIKYNPKFKNELIDEMMPNAEIAGKFVETDARRRLLDIRDPAWGRNYREKLVSRLLMFTVEKTKNGIDTLIGVAKSKSGDHHGYYIELGSKTAAAHPFLRPAVFENGRKIVNLLVGK
jgi:hypothetical protein